MEDEQIIVSEIVDSKTTEAYDQFEVSKKISERNKGIELLLRERIMQNKNPYGEVLP